MAERSGENRIFTVDVRLLVVWCKTNEKVNWDQEGT